jgi:hypothetical protein
VEERPLIQIDDEIRPMTDDEYEQYLAAVASIEETLPPDVEN